MSEFLKYVQPETVFDPETIRLLAAAFDDAWDRIEKSGSRFARPALSRATREVIAKRIIDMANGASKIRKRSPPTRCSSFPTIITKDAKAKPRQSRRRLCRPLRQVFGFQPSFD
jgi:hypothetical protein